MKRRPFQQFRDLDWSTIRSLAARDLSLALRSRGWMHLLLGLAALFHLGCFILLARPEQPFHRLAPRQDVWLGGWCLLSLLTLCIGALFWAERRLNREARAGMLADLWLAGCDIRAIILARSITALLLSLLLAAATLPGALLACAAFGLAATHALRWCMTLAACAALGLISSQETVLESRRRGFFNGLQFLWFASSMCAGLAKLIPRLFGWLYWVRQFIVDYNPISASLEAVGMRERHWPLAFTGTLLWVAWAMWKTQRSFAAEWPPEKTANSLIPRTNTLGLSTRRDWAPDLGARAGAEYNPEVTAPLDWWEERTGVRVRVGPLLVIPAVCLTVFVVLLALVHQTATVGQSLYAVALWAGSAMAAQNGGAAMSQERERGRWTELLLTRLTADEWLRAKLVSAWRCARLPLRFAAVGVPLALLGPDRPGPGWFLWSAAALALMPMAAAAMGAAIGHGAPDAQTATGRIAALALGAPSLVAVAALAQMPTGWAQALWPSHAAIMAVGHAAPGWSAWAGLAVNCGLAAAAVHWLRSSFRYAALGER